MREVIYLRWCEVCGNVYDEFDSCRDRITCEICGATLYEDDMTAIEYAKLTETEKDQYDEELLNKIQTSPFFQENLFLKYNSLNSGEFWSGFRVDKWEKLYTIQKHIDNVKRWRKENEPFKPFEPIDREKAIESTRSKVEWQIKTEQQQKSSKNNVPKCPTCNSTDISRISSTAKVVDTAMFGIFGQKRKHQFKCNNCKYEW